MAMCITRVHVHDTQVDVHPAHNATTRRRRQATHSAQNARSHSFVMTLMAHALLRLVLTSAISKWPMLTAQCSAVPFSSLLDEADAPCASICLTRSVSPRKAAVVSR